jgi:hypothetical protein
MTTVPAVSRFEANLITLARFCVGAIPADAARKALADGLNPPSCLSAACVKLVQDTLAKGVPLALVRSGGWRREPFLRREEPTTGRVWERSPLADRKLNFGPRVLSFLMWLTAERASEPKRAWEPPGEESSPADDLFFLLAADAIRAEPALFAAIKRFAFARNPYCRLARPGDYPDAPVPSFTALMTGERSVILECLQPVLARGWIKNERLKGNQTDWAAMRANGTAEHAILSAFLTVADNAGRRDLARFLVRAVGVLFSGADVSATNWLGSLSPATGPTRLAERIEVQRSGLMLPRLVSEVLSGWERSARTVGYFDDGYAAAQLFLQEWEQAGGSSLVTTANRVLEVLDPLRVQTTTG